jgi:hypothetical protein
MNLPWQSACTQAVSPQPIDVTTPWRRAVPRSECSNDDRLSPPCDTPWRMKPHYKNPAKPPPTLAT